MVSFGFLESHHLQFVLSDCDTCCPPPPSPTSTKFMLPVMVKAFLSLLSAHLVCLHAKEYFRTMYITSTQNTL